jgi:hypothetical protein
MKNSHEALLDEWAKRDHHVGKGFIRDGIIDPARWPNANLKILLLLKEAYGEGVDWDLREAIREEWQGPKYNIWWNAAYWCYAAQNAVPSIPAFPSQDDARAASVEALLSSSAINIKKSSGVSSSDDDDIQMYIENDGDLLRKQVTLISPEIIIFGNTWWFVRHLWPRARQIYDLVWQDDSTLLIDFWHPANRFPHALNYYSIGCLIQNGAVAARGRKLAVQS